MKTFPSALLLAGIHLALVGSLGLKLAVDRRVRPRVWVKAAPVDPELPVRGRYVALRLEVPVRGASLPPTGQASGRHVLYVRLEAEGRSLRALAGPEGSDGMVGASLPETMRGLPRDQWHVVLEEPLAFFLPERGADPSRLVPGEELWVEATLPRKGPLRPIRLAIRKGAMFRTLS